jgi:hypothetical protein
MEGENHFLKEEFVSEFKEDFCTTMLQAYYQNTRKYLSYDSISNITYYTGGLVMNAADWTVKENGRLLRKDNDVFIPAAWGNSIEILAFSETGYLSKSWELPPDWNKIKAVNIYSVTEHGLVLKEKNVTIENRKITLKMEPMEELSIQPGGVE